VGGYGVPRIGARSRTRRTWTGDTSFITTVGEMRVVPEDLEVTREKLRRAFRGG
jgi:hypothetical protein